MRFRQGDKIQLCSRMAQIDDVFNKPVTQPPLSDFFRGDRQDHLGMFDFFSRDCGEDSIERRRSARRKAKPADPGTFLRVWARQIRS